MENKKQSSVEWLILEIKKRRYVGGFVPYSLFEQAKAMHKEEMKEMYLKGIENYDTTFKRKDNETFGGQDNE